MKSLLLKLLVFSFLVISSINLQAQNYVVGDVNFVLGMKDYINYANINRTNSPANLLYDDIKGSPYIFEEFETGRINLEDGKTYEGPLRYDVYANQFEFKTKEGEIYSIINPETIKKISISNRIFVYKTDGIKSKTGNYFEILVEGEYSLLAKHSIILKDPVPEKPYVSGKPASFVTKEDKFYLSNDNSGLVEIKNKYAISDIDSNRSDEIEKFIKENKLKISNQSDMILIVNFLNAE